MVLGVRSCFWWICRTMGHTYRITGGQTCSIISGEDQLVCYLLNLSTWKKQRCIHMFCIVLWCCVFLQCWRLTLTSEQLFLQVFRWCDRCASSHTPSQTQEMSTRRDLIWQTSKNLTFFRKTPWRAFFLESGYRAGGRAQIILNMNVKATPVVEVFFRREVVVSKIFVYP